MIPKETIDEIFEAAIIDEVVGEFVTLKKRGVNFLGNCPFHNEKTPSFTVSPAKGIYKCFGCGKAGNAVGFIMEHEHYSYPEALRFLANKYNIDIEEEELTSEQAEAANDRESLYVVSNYATNYFKDQLHNTDKGKAIALSYFVERGFREDIIEKFQLGYSPEEWDAFTERALKEGHKLEFLEKTGLTIVKEKKHFDRFRGRVIFPIHNLSGRVIGFGGRILKTEAKAAKYLNSPESDIYHKSKVLYGLYYAKKSIVQEDNCFLVEGYTDVISLFQSGVENVVSSSGTSLTQEQIRLVKRYTPNITLLFDGDAAGIKASFRGIDMILEEGMNVRVVLFPEGEDPDSFAKKSTTEELKEYISEQAQDFIQFKTKILIDEVGNDPIKRAELIKDIVGSIAVIPDQIKRAVYTRECSSLLEISEQALINETNKIVRAKFSKKTKQEAPSIEERFIPEEQVAKKDSGESEIKHWEYEIIRILLSYGDKTISSEIENEAGEKEEEETLVSAFILQDLYQDDIQFKNQVYQEICSVYIAQLNEQETPTHQQFINHSNKEISQLAINIFSSEHEISKNWERHGIIIVTEDQQLKKAVVNTLYAFKLSKLSELIKENQEQLRVDASEEEHFRLLQQQVHLQNIKKQLANKLGRIILK